MVNPSGKLDPTEKEIKDFLEIPLNPKLNLNFKQRQQKLRQWDTYKKIKKCNQK